VNTAYNEYAFLCFHFAGHFPHELPVARIDVTRLQRASEGAEHSTSCRGNYVVDRGSVRLNEFGRIDFIMLGDCSVNAKCHRLRFTSYIGDPNGPDFALNASLGNVYDF
jgi:hypothetical protein